MAGTRTDGNVNVPLSLEDFANGYHVNPMALVLVGFRRPGLSTDSPVVNVGREVGADEGTLKQPVQLVGRGELRRGAGVLSYVEGVVAVAERLSHPRT